MEMGLKEYLIGDVAAMIGISRDTLRHYEKKGIISTRKKANGYRYYTEDDIFELSSIFYNRKMHMGLDEIENLWSGESSYETAAQLTHQKIQEEEQLIQEHQQALTRLRITQAECRKVELHLNQVSIRPFPKAYIIETCQTPQEGVIRWFHLSRKTPGFDMAYTYDSYSLDPMATKSEMVFCHSSLLLYEDLASCLQLETKVDAFPMTEAMDCLYMIVESPSRIPERALVDQMITWGQSQGLQAGTQVTSDYILHSMQNGIFHFYLELYIPIVSR